MEELYKPYYWYIGITLILLISLPALFLGGFVAYLITVLLVGVPMILLGIGGLKQEQSYYDNFFVRINEVLKMGQYKERSVNVKVMEVWYQYGKKVSPPIVEMLLSDIQSIPITTRLSYYFTKGVIVYNNRLSVTCYQYIRRMVSRESIIELLDKLSSIADSIEAKYHL